jgi:hypothetical protein
MSKDFCNADIYGTSYIWKTYNHCKYPLFFKEQVMMILHGQRDISSNLYVLPHDVLFKIFEYLAPVVHNIVVDSTIYNNIAKHKIVGTKNDDNKVTYTLLSHNSNDYLGKIYLPSVTSYDSINTVTLTNYGIFPMNGLYYRDYLHGDNCTMNGLHLNVLNNNSHCQPFPIGKISHDKFTIVIDFNITMDGDAPLLIYETIDLETTYIKMNKSDAAVAAVATKLKTFLDKMSLPALVIPYETIQVSNAFDNLAFENIIKMIIWRLDESAIDESAIDESAIDDTKWSIRLNGQDRISFHDGIYFNKIVPSRHFKKYLPPNVFMYAFVPSADEYKLQHGLNGSRIDNISLVASNPISNPILPTICYAITYSTIKIT